MKTCLPVHKDNQSLPACLYESKVDTWIVNGVYCEANPHANNPIVTKLSTEDTTKWNKPKTR